MKEITQFEGPYGEARGNPDAGYIFAEPLAVRGQAFEWSIRPHIHRRLFQLFFVDNGEFEFFESDRQRRLQGPCIILIPSASLHGMKYESEAKGRVLTMSKVLLDGVLAVVPGLAVMTAGVQCLTLFPEGAYDQLQKTYMAIAGEIADNLPERRLMLQAYLQQLFLQVYRFWLHDRESAAGKDHPALQYFRKFQELTKKADAQQTVAEVARSMVITPVHLNRICKAVAGKSAGELMQERMLEEARKYLAYTSYSVAEIAYQLNFEYANYFARWFRRHAGDSPTGYREASGH